MGVGRGNNRDGEKRGPKPRHRDDLTIRVKQTTIDLLEKVAAHRGTSANKIAAAVLDNTTILNQLKGMLPNENKSTE